MHMPTSLPNDLVDRYGFLENERLLFESLKQSPKDFLSFFYCVCNDETWIVRSKDFISLSLSWLNEQLMQNKLPLEECKVIAKAMQSNIYFFKEHLPLNITCQVLDAEIAINSFLFQASSLFFFQQIHKECDEKKKDSIVLNFIFLTEFEAIQEFVYSGEAKQLWKHKPSELLQLLEIAHKLGLDGLCSQCEEHFVRTVNEETAFSDLQIAHKRGYEVVKSACIDVINGLCLGIRLSSQGFAQLSCEIDNFSEVSLNAFGKISSFITELICGEQIIEDSQFIDIVNECPKLMSLDLSKTRNFDDSLRSLPANVRELKFQSCSWLDNESLKKIISFLSGVDSLDLSGCSQLSTAAWAGLLKLPSLRSLNISRCSNLLDDELLLVLHSCKSLESLDISECKKITEKGFYSLAKSNRGLLSLNLGRTNLTDDSLLEIVFRLQSLETLDLTRCSFLSELGIQEALKSASTLKLLDLTGCQFSDSFIEKLQQSRSYVKVIF